MAKILVADDSNEFLDIYRELLVGRGMSVVTAANGAEALQVAWMEKPDIIFLDLVMPEMTGAECARLLKQDPSCREIPVVIITSHITPKDMDACYRAGADEIMAKPFSNDQIINLLKRHLTRQP